MGTIIVYIFLAIIGLVIIYLYFISGISNVQPSKKLFFILKRFFYLIIYIGLIIFIRFNPTVVTYRYRYGCKHFLLAGIIIFILSLCVGGALAPSHHFDEPKNRKEKIGISLLEFAFFFRFVLFLLVPIFLALEIT